MAATTTTTSIANKSIVLSIIIMNDDEKVAAPKAADTPDTTISSDIDCEDPVSQEINRTDGSDNDVYEHTTDDYDADDDSSSLDGSPHGVTMEAEAETPAGFNAGEASLSASAVHNMLDDIDRILREEEQQEGEVFVSKLFSQVGSARSMALVRRPSGLMRSRNLLRELNDTVLADR